MADSAPAAREKGRVGGGQNRFRRQVAKERWPKAWPKGLGVHGVHEFLVRVGRIIIYKKIWFVFVTGVIVLFSNQVKRFSLDIRRETGDQRIYIYKEY